MNSST
ncbi:hypothetical protein E2C01_032364 [Portunus trituberculatus]